MKSNKINRRIFIGKVAASSLTVAASGFTPLFGRSRAVPNMQPHQQIQYATEHFQLTLSGNGQVTGFTDLRSNINYAETGDTKFCMIRIRKTDAEVASNKVVNKGDTLTFSFPSTPVKVKLRVKTEKSYLVFDVDDISGGDFYSLQFARVPLTIDDQKDDFAATAMSRQLNTQTLDFPGKSHLLGGQCFKELGFQGAGVFLLGMPEAQLRETMKKVVETFTPGKMPVNRTGGPYAMDHPKNYGTYSITSEPITENQVDQLVTQFSRFGVNQVAFHQGIPFRQGDFHFNEKAYPNGVSDFRKTAEAFHRHGLMVGLQSYSMFLALNSKYVTPIPSKDLDVMRTFTLAGDLNMEEKTIPVLESTAEISDIFGSAIRNSKVIRIGDELIVFEEPSPYGFTSCTRGAFGTNVSTHKKGDSVEHLTQMWGLFAPKKDSDLLLEIARETARAYNEGDFDMIYLDALDGTWTIVDDQELTWYYEALFVNEILKHTKKPPLLEYATFSPSLWYGRSRMGAWDRVARGYKQFFDIHIKANQTTADRLYLPGQMGWINLCPSNGDNTDNFQVHIFFRENVEYLGAKMLAYNYTVAFLDIHSNQPNTYRNGEKLKTYNSLRQDGYFSAETLQRLRNPDAHFLLQHSGDDWFLNEANYAYFLLRPDVREFSYHNPYPKQTPMIRIEHRHQPVAYDSPEGIDLLPFDETQPAKPATTREFKQPIDFSKHLGMGLWVYGDGGNQRINVRLESPPHLDSGFIDHILIADFTGWRYFTLAEADIDDDNPDELISCTMHPCLGVYEKFSWTVNYIYGISKVHLLVDGETKNLRFRTVRALPLTENYLIDPSLQTDAGKITFHGKIKNGHYMEYTPGGRAIVYDAAGNEVSEMQPEAPSFELPSGKTAIRFVTTTETGHSPSVRITLCTNDDQPLR